MNNQMRQLKMNSIESIDQVLGIVQDEFNDAKDISIEADLKQLHVLLCELRRRVEFTATA